MLRFVFTVFISIILNLELFVSYSFSQNNINLKIATWLGADEIETEQLIINEFLKDHPNLKIQIESIPNSYKEKILTSFASGTAPDVFVLDSPIIPSLLNKNVLLDVLPYIKRSKIDTSIYFSNVLDIFSQGDELYAFPKDYTPLMVYYNKKLFDSNNLSYPEENWSWKDFIEIAQKLTYDSNGDGNSDHFGTIFANAFYLWEPFVWMTGGDYLDPLGKTAIGYLNSPETETALQFLIDLRIKHKVSPHGQLMSSTSSATELFYSGRIGMIVAGHWRLAPLLKFIDSGQMSVGVVELPSPENGIKSNIIYATGWSVPKSAKYPELSLELAAFLGSEIAANIRLRNPIGIPGIKNTAQKLVQDDKYNVEQQFINATSIGKQPWGTKVDNFRRVERLFEQAVDRVMIGNEDMHTVMTETAYKVDDILIKSARLSNQVIDLSGDNDVKYVLIFTIILAFGTIFVTALSIKNKNRKTFYRGVLFLSPSLLILIVFIITPLIFSFYLSFHQWNIVSSVKPFVGLENYLELFRDDQFWNSFKNTIIYSFHVPFGMIISLGIALLLNTNIKGGNFFKTLFFLPSISSFVAVALVWKLIYHPQFGLANYLLSLLGIENFSWLEDPSTALFSVMLMSIWLGIGYQMVIFLSGLKNIPSEFYEAARTEGASAWKQFWYITLPLLKPTTFFVLVTSLIGSFQVFALVYVMTEGGPLLSTDVAVYHIYKNAWDYLQMGYASAMSWILFIVIMIITWIQFKFFGKEVDYN